MWAAYVISELSKDELVNKEGLDELVLEEVILILNLKASAFYYQ